ncbi:ssDNA endonuclease and repair protein rad10 [Phlyctochytrium planicorne]|nr:ssDNA endonuclease and repair protein rad10 [Phlyctochytrium planicorne]
MSEGNRRPLFRIPGQEDVEARQKRMRTELGSSWTAKGLPTTTASSTASGSSSSTISSASASHATLAKPSNGSFQPPAVSASSSSSSSSSSAISNASLPSFSSSLSSTSSSAASKATSLSSYSTAPFGTRPYLSSSSSTTNPSSNGRPISTTAVPSASESTSANSPQPSETASRPSAPQQQQQARRVNRIVVNSRQKGNPLLNHIKAVSWEYADIVPDFQVGQTSCALFLSLRYHRLHPEYIFERIKAVQQQYLLRILLVVVDIEDHQQAIRELTKGCILAGFTVFLAWSSEDAAKYLENFKLAEHRSAESIKERVEMDYLSKLTDCLTQVKTIHRTDVVTLASTFGSLYNIMNASPEEISLCPGFGEQKVRRLIEAVNTPFLQGRSGSRTQTSIKSQRTNTANDGVATTDTEEHRTEKDGQDIFEEEYDLDDPFKSMPASQAPHLEQEDVDEFGGGGNQLDDAGEEDF